MDTAPILPEDQRDTGSQGHGVSVTNAAVPGAAVDAPGSGK